MEVYALPFLARGMAPLMVDGPGQGEAEYEHPIRGDFEVPATGNVDWLLTRTDVDTTPHGLWGEHGWISCAARRCIRETHLRLYRSLLVPMTSRTLGQPAGLFARDFSRSKSLRHSSRSQGLQCHPDAQGGIARQIECPLFHFLWASRTAWWTGATRNAWLMRSRVRSSFCTSRTQSHRQ